MFRIATPLIAVAAALAVGASCSPAPAESAGKVAAEPAPAPAIAPIDVQTRPARTETAVFAGGCFWSMEKAFDGQPGVVSAVSGFTGGTLANPTYAQVVRGGTGHREAVRVTYDPTRVSYRALVDRFWRHIDPTDPDGQFCDQGPSYVTAVYVTPGQRPIAEASRAAAATALGKRIVTPVQPVTRFWAAGAEHQDYARLHPARYAIYERGCRRAASLAAVWSAAR